MRWKCHCWCLSVVVYTPNFPISHQVKDKPPGIQRAHQLSIYSTKNEPSDFNRYASDEAELHGDVLYSKICMLYTVTYKRSNPHLLVVALPAPKKNSRVRISHLNSNNCWVVFRIGTLLDFNVIVLHRSSQIWRSDFKSSYQVWCPSFYSFITSVEIPLG